MKRWSISKYDTTSNKVLLFVRLENAVRPGTILKIAKRRKISLPKNCCPRQFVDHVTVKEIVDYERFYENWPMILRVISGESQALEQITEEFVENCYDDGVAYAEVRFSPHLLGGSKLSPTEVTDIILKKLRETGEKFGVFCNVILCVLREQPEQATEVLDLVRRFSEDGTVGIALSGNETCYFRTSSLAKEIVATFDEANYFNIHRTVEAGSITPPKAVWEAIEDLSAERIGYGYRIVEDPKLYDLVYTGRYHVEVSLISSQLSSAVCSQWHEHPALQFLHDGISFSINNDMPLFSGSNLCDEYSVCRRKLNMACPEFYSSNKAAAKSAFAYYHDREDLLLHIQQANDSMLPEEARLPKKHRTYAQYVCSVCLRMVDECRMPSASTESAFRPSTYPPTPVIKFDCLHYVQACNDEKYRMKD